VSSNIFLIGRDDQLVELRHTNYDSEDLFQKLLANHPSILAANASGGTGLLLIQREYGVPKNSASSDRWSMDHLFVDRNGVPVLVEVKRATERAPVAKSWLRDARLCSQRRCLLAYRSAGADFSDGVRASGNEPQNVLAEFLGPQEPDAVARQLLC
jgi:hypothetical protein